MNVFRRRTFDFDDRHLVPGVYADCEFDRCTFNLVPFVYARRPEDRTVVRNVKLVSCDVQEPMLGTIAVEECTVENLKTHGLFMIYGAVFKHVVLRGRFGRLMFTEYLPGGGDEEKERVHRKTLFTRADEAYYEHVDWALDIREAEFYECEFRYVPGHLVRRDPETQVLVWRDKLLRQDWNRPEFPPTDWGVNWKLFVESRLSSVVIVAGKRHPKFKHQLEELNQLRELGIAEPD